MQVKQMPTFANIRDSRKQIMNEEYKQCCIIFYVLKTHMILGLSREGEFSFFVTVVICLCVIKQALFQKIR